MSKEKAKGKSNHEPRQALPPIFKVVSGGVTVDFTDKIQEANASFADAQARPKYLFSVNGAEVRCLGATM
jgi:hypothetical protein